MGDLRSRCPADRRIRRGRSRWRSAVDTLISCGLPAVSRTTEIGIDGSWSEAAHACKRVVTNGNSALLVRSPDGPQHRLGALEGSRPNQDRAVCWPFMQVLK